MDLYSHVWSLGTTRGRGRGVGVWGGGHHASTAEAGTPYAPGDPRTLKSQGSAHSGAACPCPPAQALGSLGSGHTLPVAPSRVLRPGRYPQPCSPRVGRSRAAPRPANARPTPSGLADLPQGSRRCRTRAAPPALLSLGPRLSASQGRRSEEPALGLPDKLTQENVPPGAGGGGLTVPCASATPPRCRRAGSGACRPRAAAPPPLGPSDLARELRGRARGSPIEPSPA